MSLPCSLCRFQDYSSTLESKVFIQCLTAAEPVAAEFGVNVILVYVHYVDLKSPR